MAENAAKDKTLESWLWDAACSIRGANELFPWKHPAYRHREGNSAAHLKASTIGIAQTIPVTAGRLLLGTWQGIYFCEFDGPRQRSFYVKVSAI